MKLQKMILLLKAVWELNEQRFSPCYVAPK